MTTTNQGKKNALLGGLLVFLVPIIAVSVVYFSASRLPKSKELPIVKSVENIGEWTFVSPTDTVKNGTFWKDVKIVFSVDENNFDQRVNLLNEITEDTKTHPEFSIKDPYGQVYFLALSKDEIESQKELNHWYILNGENSSFSDTNKIYLLDRDENVRGEYTFTKTDIKKLHIDTQYLLQETFFNNAKALRIDRLFKQTLDE